MSKNKRYKVDQCPKQVMAAGQELNLIAQSCNDKALARVTEILGAYPGLCAKPVTELGLNCSLLYSFTVHSFPEAEKLSDKDKIIKLLIESGADINEKSEYGFLIHDLIQRNQAQALKILLSYGVDTQLPGYMSSSALDLAFRLQADSWRKNSPEKLDDILHVLYLNERLELIFSPKKVCPRFIKHEEIYWNDVKWISDRISYELSKIVDKNRQDILSNILFYILKPDPFGNYVVGLNPFLRPIDLSISKPLKSDYNPSLINTNADVPNLKKAIDEENFYVVTKIVKDNPNILFQHHRELKGQSFLSYALLTNKEKMVKELISLGADVNEPNKHGYIIHRAILANKPWAVGLFIAAGAHIEAPFKDGSIEFKNALELGLKTQGQGQDSKEIIHILKIASKLDKIFHGYNPQITVEDEKLEIRDLEWVAGKIQYELSKLPGNCESFQEKNIKTFLATEEIGAMISKIVPSLIKKECESTNKDLKEYYEENFHLKFKPFAELPDLQKIEQLISYMGSE